MKRKTNLDMLRQMLNTEVNTVMFNPDVRYHKPQDIIIIIRNEDDHVHCIKPNNNELVDKMVYSVFPRMRWLREKVKFLENQVNQLMDIHDVGGTTVIFPEFNDWLKKSD